MTQASRDAPLRVGLFSQIQLDAPDRNDLHIAGRLDFHSTGLLLLTNDGEWSRVLGAPVNRIGKRYRVILEKPLGEEYVRAFAEGMWFAHEGITTRPAQLLIVSEHVAEVLAVNPRYRPG